VAAFNYKVAVPKAGSSSSATGLYAGLSVAQKPLPSQFQQGRIVAPRTNDVRMTLEAGKVDLKEISTNIPSNQPEANKFVNMQINQSASAHQKLASSKPSAFQKNQWSSIMRFTTPMRAGPAP
jgi:hypothetical protein